MIRFIFTGLSMLNEITFKEFKVNWKNLKNNIEHIAKNKFAVLWVSDYYDGALSGILEFRNQKFRFEIVTDYKELIYPRVFAIISLSENEVKEEIYWNELFKKHVGNHYDLMGNGEAVLKHKSEWHLFYDKYNNRKIKDYDLNIVKGWYSEE
jgi:hypothetical protein